MTRHARHRVCDYYTFQSVGILEDCNLFTTTENIHQRPPPVKLQTIFYVSWGAFEKSWQYKHSQTAQTMWNSSCKLNLGYLDLTDIYRPVFCINQIFFILVDETETWVSCYYKGILLSLQGPMTYIYSSKNLSGLSIGCVRWIYWVKSNVLSFFHLLPSSITPSLYISDFLKPPCLSLLIMFGSESV